MLPLQADSNEGVLRIPQSFSITGASPSDCFVSNPENSLERGFYPSAEIQSVYFAGPADLAKSETGNDGIKEYSAFPKAPELLKPHHQIV